MAIATLFVTLPFVVRELIPVLEGTDLSQEEAARTLGATEWQVFWHVTLPNIREALLYGVVLTNAVRPVSLLLNAETLMCFAGCNRSESYDAD
jgi:ABC-type sulfate transport system permease subunit